MSLVSETFGKYRLTERLAIGGMAEVFKGVVQGEAGFTKPVVIKRLHPRLNEDSSFVQMLIDEARITSQLTHSNICQVLDLGSVAGSYYIAMEYIPGEDLRTIQDHLLRQGKRLPVEAAIYVVTEMLAGLDYAHRKEGPDGELLHIIHRDVSPHNVLVSYEGAVKVIDFGIAKARMRLVQTQAGVIKGKYRYMSPEQASAKRIDHRTDQFAAGVVLYELLRGSPHSVDVPDGEVLRRMREAVFEPLERLRRDLPGELYLILNRALARDPRQRFEDCGAFRRQLARMLQVTGASFGAVELADLMKDLFDEERRRLRTKSYAGEMTPENSAASRDFERRDLTPSVEPTEYVTRDKRQPLAYPAPVLVSPPADSVSNENTAAATALRSHRPDTEPEEIEMPELEPEPQGAVLGRRGDGVAGEETPSRARPRRQGARSAGRWSRRDKEQESVQLLAAEQSSGPSPAGAPPRRLRRSGGRNTLRQALALLRFLGAIAIASGVIVGAYYLLDIPGVLRAEQELTVVDSSGSADSPFRSARDSGTSGVGSIDDAAEQGSVTLAIESNPPGADVGLCGVRTGLITPARTTIERRRLPCMIELDLAGYAGYAKSISRSGPAARRLVIVLSKGKGPPTGSQRPARDGTTGARARKRTDGKGSLVVTSIRQGTVYVDGKARGKTPRLELRLPEGEYQVWIDFPGRGPTFRRRIAIQPGENKSAHFEPPM
jgi:serine/threonine protein kinase